MTPEVRLGGPERATACCGGVSPDVGKRHVADLRAARTVTPAQLDQAVHQLRERRGRPAAEQMQAILRALDLTVVRDSEHRR
ncbi:hypothetical protein [Pseudonocardia zijingensis]|jgi:hypothetical protein|uniref:HTH cro/C1-type domain-containing protein n=1 Tax=Pseudonocardia zijingensis TaxID=153376 RepID=A0ABP4A9V5_9PSEU